MSLALGIASIIVSLIAICVSSRLAKRTEKILNGLERAVSDLQINVDKLNEVTFEITKEAVQRLGEVASTQAQNLQTYPRQPLLTTSRELSETKIVAPGS